MKIKWAEVNGRKRAYMIRDIDEDCGNAAEIGVPLGPPDLDRLLDWEEIKRELNNELAKRNLLTFGDVQDQQRGVSSAILSVMKNRVVLAYRQEE